MRHNNPNAVKSLLQSYLSPLIRIILKLASMQHSDRSPQSVSSHQIATIAAILGAIVVNALSNFFPLNGLSIGAISNTLFGEVLVTPANYAFAIWGVIYLGLIAFGIYQAAPARRDNAPTSKSAIADYRCVVTSKPVGVRLSRTTLLAFGCCDDWHSAIASFSIPAI